jgi:hypothetical protein
MGLVFTPVFNIETLLAVVCTLIAMNGCFWDFKKLICGACAQTKEIILATIFVYHFDQYIGLQLLIF